MKVAIIGTAPGWKRAPWSDPTWERWGINDAYTLFDETQHCTRWFELHGNTTLTRSRRSPDHFDHIRAMDIPVYYLHGDPLSPNAIRLNTDAMAAVWRDYFACTMAYQVALAMLERAETIAVYGTPLMGAREIVVERPCLGAWLGYAEGRGVRVTVDHDEPLGFWRHPYRYAEQDWLERTATFAAVSRLAMHVSAWLQQEAMRVTSSLPTPAPGLGGDA